MNLLNAIILILAGIGAMGFGLLLFYALLPLFYGLFGAGVGYWLGSFLTTTLPGEMSLIKFVFAAGGAIAFASSAYFFEPFRRILIGVGLGSLLGGVIAGAIGLSGFLGAIIMVAAGVAGGLITLAVFDLFIVISAAFGGAALAMDGLHLLLGPMGLFDRSTIAEGATMPLVIWTVAGAVGTAWQLRNLERWAAMALPGDEKPPGPADDS